MTMKKLLVLCLLVIGGMFMNGCTVSETVSERHRRIAQITNLQMKMAVEDWDYIWLYDHNIRMNTWHTYIGGF
jgi:outer membrane lipoprotein-sorting protein